MSYQLIDLLVDAIDGDTDAEHAEGLVWAFAGRSYSDLLYEEADRWQITHMDEPETNDYLRGVLVGLKMAARQVREAGS